jgi:hypothetical protein
MISERGENDHYGDKLLKSHTQAKSVLVNLDALYPPPAGATDGEGLKLTGWASEALHGCSSPPLAGSASPPVLIETHEGRTYRAEGQLIPADPMRPQ